MHRTYILSILFIHAQAIASIYVDNTTLQHEYFTLYGERVWVYSIRLNRAVTAEELKHSLGSATDVITRVVVIRREGTSVLFKALHLIERHYIELFTVLVNY